MGITKSTTHISPNEQLIFERSQPGRAGYSLPPLDVDETALDEIVPRKFQREDKLAGMPEVTEVDVIRHFTRISTWNYSIDQGMYPLGSCTMKYNSRLNEKVARIANFANLHPLASEAESQGALQVIYELQEHLAEITGLREVLLKFVDDLERALRFSFRSERMQVRKVGYARDLLIQTRVVLHGARAERIHALIDGVIPG